MMDIKELYQQRHGPGLRGRLIRFGVWWHQHVRPPHPYPGRNQQYAIFQKYLNGRGDVLLLGSNLPAERLKNFGTNNKVVQIDLKKLEHVDYVVNAEEMSAVLPQFDYVVSTSMLEHTPHPWKVVEEVYKTLRPGGIFYLAVPWMFPLHGEPYDYWRFSLPCLKTLIAENGFAELEAGSEGSPHGGLYSFLKCYFPEVLSFGSAYAYYALEYLFSWILYPVGLTERLFRLRTRQHCYTDSLLYVIGKKQDQPSSSASPLPE